MIKNKNLLFVLFVIFALTQCKKMQLPSFTKNENFSEFNQKFHQDSAFQMSRIQFPVEGQKRRADTSQKWKTENWVLHKTPVGNTKTDNFEVKVVVKENVVTEKIWIESSEFYVERKFKRINGKWYLVYYDDASY
jgi:hypothetical protein